MAILAKYPTLREEVLRLVSSEIDKKERETNHHLVIHIQAQKSFMNTRHPSFKPVHWSETTNKEETDKKENDDFLRLPTERKPSNGHNGHNSKFFVSNGEEVEEYLYFTGKLNIMFSGLRGSRD